MPQGTANPPSGLEKALVSVLAERLEARSMSLSELARATGVSVSQLSRIFAGVKTMRLGEFTAVCDALGISASDAVALAEVRQAKEVARADPER